MFWYKIARKGLISKWLDSAWNGTKMVDIKMARIGMKWHEKGWYQNGLIRHEMARKGLICHKTKQLTNLFFFFFNDCTYMTHWSSIEVPKYTYTILISMKRAKLLFNSRQTVNKWPAILWYNWNADKSSEEKNLRSDSQNPSLYISLLVKWLFSDRYFVRSIPWKILSVLNSI